MEYHDELSGFLKQGLAVRVDGIPVDERNVKYMNQLLSEDDLYMKDFVGDQKGEICAVEYQHISNE